MSAGQAALDEAVAMAGSAVDVEGLVRAHSRLVFRVAYSVLRNREDAEDAAQETFIRLMRQDLSKIDDPRLWLARVAWRVAVDRVRKRPETTDEMPEIADSGASADDALLDAELQARVQSLIEALPRKLREVVRLSTVEEMTSADVAQVLGIPEGTVRTRMSRARQILREKLMTYMEKK